MGKARGIMLRKIGQTLKDLTYMWNLRNHGEIRISLVITRGWQKEIGWGDGEVCSMSTKL